MVNDKRIYTDVAIHTVRIYYFFTLTRVLQGTLSLKSRTRLKNTFQKSKFNFMFFSCVKKIEEKVELKKLKLVQLYNYPEPGKA